VIARGGGSKEDLKEFNSETLARGVHDSLIPVLSAIGHESDYTLTDFAADKRAGTPSIAAEMIAKNNNSFFSYYFSSLGRIYKNLILQSNSDGRRLSNLISRLYYRLNGISLQARQQVYKNNFRLIRAVENKFEKSKERLKKALEKINRSIIRQCENRSHQISMLQIKLNQLNPSKVLSGGYAIVFKENERLLSVKDVSKDDELEINLSDGKITVRVIK
jgi:exodeoxyribonuclease VII large subunit